MRFVTRNEAAELPVAKWTRAMVTRAFDRSDTPYFAPATWKPPQ